MRNIGFALFCAVLGAWMLYAIDTIMVRRDMQRGQFAEQLYKEHQAQRSKMDCVTDLECCMQYGDCDE